MSEDTGLAKYADELSRGKRRGDIENLLASELAQATHATDLVKLKHICEAYMMLSEDEKRKVFPEQEEEEWRLEDTEIPMPNEIERIHAVTLDFQQMIVLDIFDGGQAFIPFSFPVERAYKYLAFMDGIFFGTKEFTKEEAMCLYNVDKRKYFGMLQSHFLGGNAMLRHCLMLKNMFISPYAMPICLKLMRKIFTTFVSVEKWESAVTTLGV